MVTMLDCIKRVAPITEEIIRNAQTNTDGLVRYLNDDIKKIDEIVVVAAGSSNTAAVTGCQFMEKVSGVEVHTYIANQFAKKTVFNPNALYVYVSQTGTSTLVKEMLVKMNELGHYTAAITESAETPIALEAGVHIDMGCGYEEYWYRTIGYCSSFITLMLTALRIGLEKGNIDASEYNDYLQKALRAAENHPKVVARTVDWFHRHEQELKNAKSILIYGSGPLYGVALEGALKMLETAKHCLAFGYEAEDGLHGPTLGFTKGDLIIALNDGVNDEWMSHGLINYSKRELGAGYVFGANPLDDDDLEFEIIGEDFRALEFAPALETVAYLLALAVGTPVEDAEHAREHVSSKYFETHRG